MTRALLPLLGLAAVVVSAIPASASPAPPAPPTPARDTNYLRPGCKHGPKSRKCWGNYDINTNWYDTVFHTGRTREYWLNVEEVDCAPDGYKRKCILANGTMPGPAIVADWGDEVVVHVTNNHPTNGTAVHWHGIRQYMSTEFDGVPGVTQCPIPPGETMTYKFHATQYGSSMYHSHFSLQYVDGFFGPLVINGPATAEYDEDLGTIFLTDWEYRTAWQHWASVSNFRTTEEGFTTGLINGMNTAACNKTDPACIGPGKKFEVVFEPGKKYRMRLVNLASEAWYQWSIDGHKMTVIAADLVPIVPFTTDSILVNDGERYDVIIEANAKPGDYWMRSGHVTSCIKAPNADNLTAIVRYKNKKSTAMPKSKSTVVPQAGCLDEPASRIVPWVPVDLPNTQGGVHKQWVTGQYYQGKFLRWSFNKADGGFVWTNWSQPAIKDVVADTLDKVPLSNNVFQIATNSNTSSSAASKPKPSSSPPHKDYEWAIISIDELTPIPGVSHPVHLHGHDFLLLESGANASWDGTTTRWQTKNPPRRDTAILPPNGYMVIAIALDNPGIWLLHCHIAWHASQGFGVTVLEDASVVQAGAGVGAWGGKGEDQCKKWNAWYPGSPYHQEDSGV